MNVIIAGTPGNEHLMARALDWANGIGAPIRHDQRTGAGWVALASDEGPAAAFTVSGGSAIASLGLHPVLDTLSLGRGWIAPHTVAVSVDADRVVAGAGEGNQRLFRYDGPRGTLVSSHVGALVAALDGDVTFDRSYEDFHLGFGFLPDGRTMFEHITALERPAVTVLGGTPIDTTEPRAAPGTPEAPREATDLAELVLEIVDEQAGDARTVGVLLGGFDSALVAACLRRSGRDVHTFTFSFEERDYVQRNVDPVVEAASAVHHWVPFTPDILGEALQALPTRLNQPSPQPHYQLQTILAGEAARAAGVDVIFTGDGCDALFAAFPTVNTRAAANARLRHVPGSLRRGALPVLGTRLIDERLGHVARMGRSAVRASLLDEHTSRHLPTQYWDEYALARLRLDRAPVQSEDIAVIRARLAAAVPSGTAGVIAHAGNALTGQSQSKVEGLVARAGLPVFSPYTAPRFRAAVAALPVAGRESAERLAGRGGKPALQQAAVDRGLLSEQVVYQRKQSPTEAPVDAWYAGPLRSTVLAMVDDLPFDVDHRYLANVLRPKAAERMYRERVAISRHVLQVVGLLASYASFAKLAR